MMVIEVERPDVGDGVIDVDGAEATGFATSVVCGM
jgi:hypothetical protein